MPALEALAEDADEVGEGGGGGPPQTRGSGSHVPPLIPLVIYTHAPNDTHLLGVHIALIPVPHNPQSLHIPILELADEAGGGGKIGGVRIGGGGGAPVQIIGSGLQLTVMPVW